MKKDLLISDLGERLPYHVIVRYRGGDVDFTEHSHSVSWSECRPYLKSMSSITKSDRERMKSELNPEGTGWVNEDGLVVPATYYGDCIHYSFIAKIVEWLVANHYDWRGLIPEGLAIEVNEDNDPYRE